MNAERTEYFLKHALSAALAFVIAGATYLVLTHLVSFEPFGHDDSVYLTKAREWLAGTPADQWGIYRPAGMSIVAWILLHFGDSEYFLRMFGVCTGALTASLVFLFFRSVSNLWTAISITLITTTSYVFLLQAPQFLNDIVSSGILFALLWVIYIHYKSSGRSNVIFLAAPISALAFYLRYGVVEAIVVIAVCSLFFLLSKFLRDESADFRRLALTGVLTLVLLVPHFIYSASVTKELLGVLTSAGEAAHRAFIGEGLVQYFKWLPDQLGGWPLGIAAIFGSCVFVFLLCIKSLRNTFPVYIWIGSIGLGTFILTGLLVHAEARYVFFPMILLAGLGILAIDSAARRVSVWLAYACTVAICAISIAFGVAHYRDLSAYIAERESSPLSEAYSLAHKTVHDDSAKSGGCSLWVVRFQPRASWYTGCRIYDFNNEQQFRRQFEEHSGEPAYSIVVTDLTNEQVDEKFAPRLGVVLNELSRIRMSSNNEVIVYRIVDLNASRPLFTPALPAS